MKKLWFLLVVAVVLLSCSTVSSSPAVRCDGREDEEGEQQAVIPSER